MEVKGQINVFLSAEASSPEEHECVLLSLPDFICEDWQEHQIMPLEIVLLQHAFTLIAVEPDNACAHAPR